jgi:hypothetical protein
MEKDYLALKRASISHRSGKERDYDVLAYGVVVGRIFKVRAGRTVSVELTDVCGRVDWRAAS